MKQKKQKPYQNQKIANLFMCKRQIEKLRQKVLGLIQQPCQDFQWRKKQTVKIKSQYHQKSQLKQKTKNKTNKAQLFSQKKICPCTKFWSQQVKKTKQLSPFRKNNRHKQIENKKFQTKNKIRTKIQFEQSNLFDKETPKKYKVNQDKKPNIFVSQFAQIQPSLTLRKSNKKHRSVNTQSTIDQISDKKLKSPQSVLLYSKTERVKFEENENLCESFLLSQKSILPELALKNSRRQSRGSKCSQIRIQPYEEKNNLEKSNCYVIKQDDSLLISGLNSKYWKGSSKKIADSIKSQNQQKVNETNLFQTQKQNDRNMINRSLASKNQENSDLIASWTLGNFSLGQMQKKPLSLDLIRKICQKTQKFMNSQIYPFREVLCDQNEVENLKDSLALSRSLMKSEEKSYVQGTIGKLWIDEV